ncbi:MAG TPA: bifunctional UDP-N-acetylglucosamine diphosphorylase/glucosamine-1-phosphate N-acetyltransferase GlmU [Candidatus Limnocylindria bacterium]|jgi:bifunctional UDP-N-acetylglucosamine pyrophosphorylase/glucosamine-1-phosphate N-acetyltransferase|nr:bifunctional UDP-N-acetylglucosamine diphosphorylase/glucosamine-1-phosphate N-acetyltransferase GlmU [Candidatus Limnocylindria bacterium]
MTVGPPGIVLAAGLGTRMRSQTPKVLHLVAGRPLLAHVLEAVRGAGARPVVVLSKESEPARAIVGDGSVVAMQDPPHGTGDAVRVALEAIPDETGDAFIVYSDTPLLRASTLRALAELRAKRGVPLALLSGLVGTANAYGRVIRDAGGDVARVVEVRLATAEERRLPESNLGAYAVDLVWLRKAVPRLRANETGEVFLTDLVALAAADGARVAAYCTEDSDEGMGVNTRVELAAAEDVVRKRIRERHMLAGVTFHDPGSSLVDADVEIAADVVIERGCVLEGRTRIAAGTRVGPYAIVRDTTIGERCRVEASVLEGATLEDDVTVGPYSHLRPGAHLEKGVQLGNFGEVKNARLGKGTKMHHFSYVGDAQVGERVNIGAGTITLNYDGVRKHRTEIGDDAFIGSDTLLRAPIKVGARAVTGAGSVVTKDVPDDMLAVGVPARIRKKTERRDKAT